ncbi:MAG: CCA tRNA nucleotidyltransferase, partial [Synergistaceae bacterium]|nr:CCA tRNA nucleotidyltransferase [Synergistaceae bacterium]
MKSSGKNLIMAGRIARAVHEEGGRSFFVGGYVRDEVSGRCSKDIDIEVHGVSEARLAEILDGLGERLTMGASFGIFGLKHYTLDIVMPRSSSGDVAPFIGFREAARRRDFTMNALMKDVMTGEILDYFGGVYDINNKIIRHV